MRKLNRKERIRYLKTGIDLLQEVRCAYYYDDINKIKENIRVNLTQPIYSWWTIFKDVVIALMYRQ
jgi:hypothetical protein